MLFGLGKLYTKFGQIDGTYKDERQKYFNTKKTHAIYHFNSLPGVCYIYHFDLCTVTNLHRGVEWVGSFLKNFRRRGGESY